MTEERNCKSVRLNLWDYAAQRLTASESDLIDAHLDACRDCDRCLADVSSLRTGFRQLPVKTVPPLVATKVQVLASRERSRQLLRLDPAAWLRDKISDAVMSFDNFLRPFAVPATGGILASCLCFALIAHTLQLRPYLINSDFDMPLALNTEVMINDVTPFSFSKKDFTVELSVDAKGNVTDATPMPQNGQASAIPTREQQQQIESLVLYSTFTPATRFGQPVSSKRLFAFGYFDVQD